MSLAIRAAVTLLVTGLTATTSANAQRSTCSPELIRSGGVARSIEVPGGFHQFLGGGVLARCRGEGTTMQADSVAWYSDRNRMDFEGHVQFRDSAVTLNSDRASYYMTDERLEALGNVRLQNEETGSTLVGTRLTYLRDVAGIRDTIEIYAVNRPTVEYRSESHPESEPYVIVADRVRLRGDDVAWAGGRVTIDREGFAAKGDSALLDTGVGSGFLLGGAEAAGSDSARYTLVGHRVEFRLVDNSVNWIQSQDSAVATSAEWELEGDTVEFELANDLIQRGAAWGDSARPEARSAEQVITADSLVIDAPDQVLHEVRGVGEALARSIGDSVGEYADWIQGDTVVATFDDLETGGRGLTELAGIGNARSFYHIFDEATPEALPAINYARGRQITVRFLNGDLDRVDVVDGADGVYLEPPGVRRPKP